MGLLVDGKWSSQWYDTKKSAGHLFVIRPAIGTG